MGRRQESGGIVTDYLSLLSELHATLKPRNYLEIGVQTGASLRLASCPSIGVDPSPCIRVPLPATAMVFPQTSDGFFTDYVGFESVDFAFVDGLHHFDQVLKDVQNILRYSHPGTVIAVHDTLPRDEATSGRNPLPGHWTGDVWRAMSWIAEAGYQGNAWTVNAPPSGLTIFGGLSFGMKPIEPGWFAKPLSEYEPLNPVSLDDFRRDFALWREGVASAIV